MKLSSPQNFLSVAYSACQNVTEHECHATMYLLPSISHPRQNVTLSRNWTSRNEASTVLTTVLFIRSISTVIFPVTHKRVSNTLPVGTLELSGVTSIGGSCAGQFVRSVITVIKAVTHLPFGNANVICATKLRVKTTVRRCKRRYPKLV